MYDMTYPMIVLLALCCGAALVNWRQAIFLTIVLDAFRDPMRKLTPNQPVWMSQAIVLVWLLIFLNCLSQNARLIHSIRKVFPRSREGTFFLIAALIPGAIVSFVSYSNGWILVVIGALSYLGPLLGLLIGAAFADRTQDVYRFMKLYVLINALVLVGSVAEHYGWNWPGLGGLIGFEWIRHMPGVLVRMVSGFFRSPDIAGFHAAHVVIFSLVLAVPQSRTATARPHWLPPGLLGLFALFLAGRRKMFSIPVIFLIVWLVIDLLRRQKGSKNLLLFAGTAMVIVGAGAFYFVEDDSDLEHHQIYMSTTVFDILPKLYEHSFQGSVVTVNQSGIMGSGLGVATQGAQYSGADRVKAWQEDGVSRLFKELGVIGVILLIMAASQFVKEFRRAFRMPIRDTARVILQNAGIAIFIANIACFAVSHQHISGDVANGILPLLFLGGVFGHVLGDLKTAQAVPARPGAFGVRPMFPPVMSAGNLK